MNTMHISHRSVLLITLTLVMFLIGGCTLHPVVPPTPPPETETDRMDFLDIDLAAIEQDAAAAYQAGDYALAVELYLNSLRHNTTDAYTMYNLACCYGLLGDAKSATTVLRKAVRAGFDDYAHIQKDPDFDPVRESVIFQTALKEIQTAAEKLESEQGDPWLFRGEQYQSGRVILPQNYEVKQQYPLVVGLHGVGSNAASFSKVFSRTPDRSFIYLALQAPYAFPVGNALGYSWSHRDAPRGSEVRQESWKLASEGIIHAIQEFKQHYNISDVILMGFSQGAGTATLTGILHPAEISAVIQYAGWLDHNILTETDIMNASKLPFLMIHGDNDRGVPYEDGVKSQELLSQAGYDITFISFEGGHRITKEMVEKMTNWIAFDR